MTAATKAERFQTSALLRIGTLLALPFWLAVTGLVLLLAAFNAAPLPLQLFLGLALFDFLFFAAALHYHHRRFIVDDEGIVLTGALSFKHIPWDEVVSIAPEVGYLPGYQMRTQQGIFGFSGIELPGHQRLYEFVRMHARKPKRPAVAPPPRQDLDALPAALRRRVRSANKRRRGRRL